MKDTTSELYKIMMDGEDVKVYRNHHTHTILYNDEWGRPSITHICHYPHMDGIAVETSRDFS